MKKSETQNIAVVNDDETLEGEQECKDLSLDARDVMIEAVKAAADDGAFPTILISIGPALDSEGGPRIDVAWLHDYDRDSVVDLLLGAVEALTGDRH